MGPLMRPLPVSGAGDELWFSLFTAQAGDEIIPGEQVLCVEGDSDVAGAPGKGAVHFYACYWAYQFRSRSTRRLAAPYCSHN